jgi:hypothetical protein
MGLFSTKKKVYVASTIYKVVDDGSDRSDFIRETIAGVSLSNNPNASYADAIQAGLRTGPRAMQRSFFRWAKNNIDDGMPRAAISYTETIDDVALASQILTDVYGGDTSYTINIVNSLIDNADETYYAEEWIYENQPARALEDWAADADPITDDIYIQWPDGSSTAINVPDYNSSNDIIVAYYTVTTDETPEPTEEVPEPEQVLVTTPTKAYIYELGSGNASLDNRKIQTSSGVSDREFYPFLPLRIDNRSVFGAGSPAAGSETEIREAWEKALGTDMQDAIDEIESNEDIDDIDYAYLVFGVCLNTTDHAEKSYIHEFFKLLADRQDLPTNAFESWASTNNVEGFHERFEENIALVNTDASNNPDFAGIIDGTNPATYGTAPRIQEVHLTLPNGVYGVLDMKISWTNIQEETINGLIDPDAKVGDVTITSGTRIDNEIVFDFEAGSEPRVNSAAGILIKKQISRTQYSQVKVDGLMHKNLIYSGKSVDITAAEALADSDDSGFIIPMHEPTLKSLGGIKATDVAREGYLMVFNSYQVVKKKWYQSGIFGFILAVVVVVVAAVITVVTAGAGTPAAAAAGAGVLGSAAAVGAALGFSGLLAVAIGAAANTIAAMIILQLVNVAGGELFGDKLGRILTAVTAVIIALGSGPGGFSFDNVTNSVNWANMAAMDKLSMLTNAASDLYGSIQQERLESILGETAEVLEEYEEEMKRLEELMAGLDSNSIIDPLMLTDFTSPIQEWSQMGMNFQRAAFFGETPQDFLDRTLLTGSDMINLSHSMVTDFVDAALTLP